MSELQEDQKIYEIATAVAQCLGLEIVEVKIGRHKGDTLIQILADKPQGGIGLEECSALNRLTVEAIDKACFLKEDSCSLEVSSPGLDRPLISYKDFLRNLNRKVQLWLKEQVGEKKEYIGVIKSVQKDGLVISTTTKDRKDVFIPLDKILKGVLVI